MTGKIKIATYNVNSIRSRLPVVLNWLDKNSPDILCMQETKVEDKNFPADDFTQAGYIPIFHGQKAYSGVAIVSKEKPKKIKIGLGGIDEPDQARLISANIAGIYIINAYVPQGREMESEYFEYKTEWLFRFREYLNRNFTPKQKLLWCGDLNIAPENIDVYDPKGLKGHVDFNDIMTQIFHDFIDWGFIDIFRKHKPEGGHFTYFDFRAKGTVERNVGWRVDHILATKSLAKKSIDSYIDMKPRRGEKPSDHTPLVADFEI